MFKNIVLIIYVIIIGIAIGVAILSNHMTEAGIIEFGNTALVEIESDVLKPETVTGDLAIIDTSDTKVKKDDIIAYVGPTPVMASIDGMLRGLIRTGYECNKGLKIADIDPRGDKAEYTTMSDKARSISGSVLEVVDSFFSCPDKWK